jgi:hypothetical protein
MNRNRVTAAPAPYGQKGKQIYVENGDSVRVTATANGMSAEVQMVLTEAEALTLAAQLLAGINADAAEMVDVLADAAWAEHFSNLAANEI